MNNILSKQESSVVNVGIYARVSTDLDSQKTSNEHQVALLKEHALTVGKREGTNCFVSPEHIYEDTDVSGSKVHIRERPAMKRLIHDVETGKIQVVLFKGVTRFGRDMEDGVSLYRQLTRLYRVRVLSLEEGFDSTKADADTWFNLYMVFAQMESDKISTRVSYGNKAKVRNGKWANRTPPDGYILGEDYRLIPDPERAHVVQLVFDLYLNKGLGTRRIAEHMTHDTPYKSKKETIWSANSVSRMLKNKAYIGTVEWNKTSVIPIVEGDTKKLKRFSNDKEHVIVVEDAHEPIIDLETFVLTQERIDKRKGNKSLPNVKYPLSGILRCGRCGAPMNRTGTVQKAGTEFTDSKTGKTYARKIDNDNRKYTCSRQHSSGKRTCDLPFIKATQFERHMWLELKNALIHYVDKEKIKDNSEVKKKEDRGYSLRLKKIDAEIKKLEQAQYNMTVNSDAYTPESFRNNMFKLNEDIQRLSVEKSGIVSQSNKEIDETEKDKRIGKLIEESFLADPENTEQMREVFQRWFDKIVVHDRGKYEVVATVHGLGIVD